MVRHVVLGVTLAAVLPFAAHTNPQAAQQQEMAGFKSFQEEANRVTPALNCQRPKTNGAMAGFGALYGCVQGRAETAKFFINEISGRPGVVQNVKVMWNEWTRNAGDGLAADRTEALQMATVAGELYAPKLKARIIETFMGKRNTAFTDGPFRFEYRYSEGPAIGEHLLTITARQRL